MPLEKGWFKNEEEKDGLQEIVDQTIDEQKRLFELAHSKYKASQIPDDQELNNIGQAVILDKKLEMNPEIAKEIEGKIKIPPNEDEGSHYITQN